MSHTTTMTIGGTPVVFDALSPYPKRLSLRLHGVSTLTLERTASEREAVDPHCGKTVELSIDGDLVFAGDIVDADPQRGETGWQTVYQCRDLRARGDRVPFTDSNTLIDFATYNNDAEDPDKVDSRLGRTVGQIIQDSLEGEANAAPLHDHGIGGYTVAGDVYTLDSDTLADLAAMTLVPPQPVRIGGEAMLTAIDSFLSAWAPNYSMWVRPDGVIRFIDMRAVAETVLDMDDCAQRVQPSGLSRSVGECFQRVLVRGQTSTRAVLLSLAAGTLEEDFAWGTYSNADAKANWNPDYYLQDQDARSEGTCSCTDTTHVVLTSVPDTDVWGANDWDQTHRQGRLYVWKTTGTGLTLSDSSRIVANTAKTSGGTSTVTLETPLQAIDYDGYAIYGLSSGASYVYRKYKVVDPDIRAALARRFTYPVPYVLSNGAAATMTSYPIASVCWYMPGATKLTEFPDPIYSIDPSDGTIILQMPTYIMANGAPPADVRVLAAVNTAKLAAIKPDDTAGSPPTPNYTGTSHTVDGLSETLALTVDGWRDPANQANMDAYAQDVLDSVKDAMIEGTIVLEDMLVPALTFGLGISLESSSYTTGWEGLNIPVVGTDLTWNSRRPSHYTTAVQVSSRRRSYAVGAFLAPERKEADGTLGYADQPMMMDYGGGQGYDDTSYSGDGGNGSVVMDAGGGFDMTGGAQIDWNTGRDMRSSKDSRSAKDSSPWKDQTSARDETSSGGRGFAAREADKAIQREAARQQREEESRRRRIKGAENLDTTDI